MKHDLLLNNELSKKIHRLIYDMKLHLYDIDYFSFGFNDYKSNLAYSFTSRPEWYDFMKKDEEAGKIIFKHDYVWKNSFNFHDNCIVNKIKHNERTFLISSFDYSSKMHKEILIYKQKFEINRGVSYLEHSNYRSFSSNFYTNYKKFDEIDFAIKKRFIMKKIHLMSKIIVMKHFKIDFESKLQEQQIQFVKKGMLYLDHRSR
ncbi:hypothetical protein JCM31447_28050 [Fluviispira sanaruensis]|uniref:Uncharacterized protein n=1 Tax=Fluviispira sanaruensis TaxID=2493639 RepID=A0A4P2VMW2_FLUSA|nr:hypothetical protein JCM31447_28050 [Fluviispira sanaruensis]